MERHYLFMATQQNHCGPYPFSAPVTVYNKDEKVSLFTTGIHLVDSQETRPISTSEKAKAQKSLIIKELESKIEGLSSLEKSQLRDLLFKFSDVISSGTTDLGRTQLVPHQVNTGADKLQEDHPFTRDNVRQNVGARCH